MNVRVQCPNPKCGKSYRVDDSQMGRSGVCKFCGQKFTLGDSSRETGAPGAESETGRGSSAASEPASAGRDETRKTRKTPARLGRFEIRARLGAGAFGTVYRAYDPTLQREVALKVPQAAVLERPKARARFLREPKAAAQLQHPHIVPVFEAGKAGEHYYIASAFIEGCTLSDLIEEDAPDLRRSAQIVHDLADALHYAHQAGVVHRDVKPGNIMINQAGQAMLMDFGLARLEDSQEKLTQDGAVMGTPAYMAPEQASSSFGPVGPAADQYGLGVVLYELLCGQTPFSGTPSILIYNTLNREPDSPRNVRRSVPRDLETICLKAMAKESGQRYADCGELAGDLDRWLKDEPILARRIGPLERVLRWRRRRPALAATLAAAVLLLAVVAVLGVRYVKTSGQLDQQTAQRREAQQQREQAEQEKTAAQEAREAAEAKLLETQASLQKALAALHEAEAALAAASTDAEREAAEKKLIEAKKLVAEAQKQQDDAQWEQALAETPAPGDQAKPAPEELKLSPLEPPKNPPLGGLALVSRPTPIPGVKSWSIETRAQRGYVTALTYSPDGRRLATAGPDGAIRIWSAPAGKLQTILLGHTGYIHDLAWSPNGKTLASAGADGTVRLWDMASGRMVQSLNRADDRQVLSLAWSPDGGILASGGFGPFELYDVLSQKRLEAPSGLKGFLSDHESIAWSPDGKFVACGRKYPEDETRIVNAESGRVMWELDGCLVAWSPDGKIVACATQDPVDAHLYLYDPATGSLTRTVTLGQRGIRSWDIAWSPDGRILAVAIGDASSTSHHVDLLDPRTSRSWSVDSAGSRLAWSPDGQTLACVSRAADQGDIHFVNLASRQVRQSAQGHRTGIASVAWSHGGTFLASGDFVGNIQLWNLANRRRVRTLNENPNRVESLAWSPDDRWLAAGLHWRDNGQEKTKSNLYVWRMRPGTPHRMLRGHTKPVWSVAWSPDGTTLAAGGEDATVRLWNAPRGEPLAVLRDPSNAGNVSYSPAMYVTWSPDGTTLAGRFASGRILLWDRASQKLQRALDVPNNFGGLAWSPDGKVLGYGTDKWRIDFWDLRGQAVVHALDPQSPDRGLKQLLWSPDGSMLAAAGYVFPNVGLLDRHTGKVLRRFPSNNTELLSGARYYYRNTISWSPSGATLAMGSVDGTIGLWDVAAGYPKTVLVSLRANQWMAVSAAGHWVGSPGVEQELVYVVQTDEGQQMLTPAEFGNRYRWKNDPAQVTAAAP